MDGLVWRLERDSVKHIATFPAMGHAQANKTQRKFVSVATTASELRNIRLWPRVKEVATASSLSL
jgi:hypothetical protein